MRLSDVEIGAKVIIVRVHGQGALRKRLSEIGFVKEKIVEVVRSAPLGTPLVYKILGAEIAIRSDTASMIEVIQI
jgi:ferrous iron transport protein B